jgi:hypothetical protein
MNRRQLNQRHDAVLGFRAQRHGQSPVALWGLWQFHGLIPTGAGPSPVRRERRCGA